MVRSDTMADAKKTTPKNDKPKTEAEQRKEWGERANKTLAALDRAAKNVDRVMKRAKVAREDQIKAFREGVNTLTDRAARSAKGEASAGLVPLE